MQDVLVLNIRRSAAAMAMACFLLPALATPALSQTVDGVRIVTVSLLSGTNDARKPFTVGLRFRLAKEWHLYWKNPGDAGLPVEATWSLPPGYKVSALEHPVPKKLASDEATCYVYDTEVTLLATITPPKGAARLLPIGVKLDWLVCRERCVPGGDSVSAVIGSIPSSALSEGAAAIARTRAALPRPLASAAIGIGAPTRRTKGDSLIITVPLTGAGAHAVTDFFPESDEALALNHAAIRVAQGRIVLPYLIADRHAHITELRGLLIRNGAGYSARIPF